MKRSSILIALGLLAVGFAFDRGLSRAQEGEKPASALQAVRPDEISEVADLLDRIEALEKRLASLEGREPLIRQADSRESSATWEASPNRSVKSATTDPQDNDDEDKQKTNGRTWSIRLLGHR